MIMSRVIVLLWMLVSASLMAQDVNQTDVQGRKHGKWVKTWPGSKMKQLEGQFEHGVPVGEFKSWYETGEFHALIRYSQNGKVQHVKSYHHNGYIKMKAKYLNEDRDSTWLYFDTRGRVLSKETYKNGKLNGEMEVYYTSEVTLPNGMVEYVPGIPSHRYQYRDGLRHGPYKELFTTGVTKEEGNYVDGNLDGKITRYSMGGAKEAMIHYKYAVKNGWALYYDELGNVKTKVFYHNGKVLEGEALEKQLEKNKQEQLGNQK